MKLISCHVEGFGNLTQRDFTFENLTVIMRENGAGKTTLASFIKAMFYGLPSVRTGGNFNERQRFCPFDGSRFGGNLTFEKDGKTYRIERFFDKKSETRDELTLYLNGKRVPASDIGKETFGLDAQSFARTAFITSEITESGAGGDINKLLNRGAGTTTDADFEAAVNALDIKRKQLKADRGKKGLLYDKKDARQQLVYEIEQLRERERELGARYSERTRLTQEISELEGAKERQTQVKVLSAKRAVLDELRGENVERSDTGADGKRNGKAKYALLALAVLLIAGGAGLCIASLAGIAVMALGLAAMAWFAYLCAKSKKRGGETDKYALEINRLSDEIDDMYAQYDIPMTEEVEERLRDRRRKLGILDGVIAAEEAELELLPDKLSRLESADEELGELTKKHETLVLAAEFLKQADRAIKDKYVAPVRGRFEYYADEIKAVLGQKMSMDADFSVSFEKNGSQMGEKHLSAGQRSIVSLCLRLALIDNMYENEKPFIIMDDPFVNLDGANFEGCKRVIRALSKQIQIIYFTCHNSRMV